MNPALSEARAANAAEQKAAHEAYLGEREVMLSGLRVRYQATKTEVYGLLREYMEAVRVRCTEVCVVTTPDTGVVLIAKAQGAIEFIQGMEDYFENADREAAQLEQTAG